MTLTGGEANLASTIQTTNTSVLALQQHHHLPVFEGFWKVEVSSNGLGMTQSP
jgi:hypothetical protein